MFCTQCGKELGSGQLFCGSCGASAELTNGIKHASGLEAQGAILDFGKAKLKFWGRLPPASASILPESYLWLLEDITLTVFDNYLTVTPGSEERSKIADIATSGAMPLVTLFAGAVRVVKDKVVNELDTPSIDVFQKAFVAGDLLWCSKKDAVVWELQQKRFIGLKTPSLYLLNCSLNSPTIEIPFLFPLGHSQDTFFVDPVNAIGCSIIVKQTGLKEDQRFRARDELVSSFYRSR